MELCWFIEAGGYVHSSETKQSKNSCIKNILNTVYLQIDQNNGNHREQG